MPQRKIMSHIDPFVVISVIKNLETVISKHLWIYDGRERKKCSRFQKYSNIH